MHSCHDVIPSERFYPFHRLYILFYCLIYSISYLYIIVGCGNDRFGGCGSVLSAHVGVSCPDWQRPSLDSEPIPIILGENNSNVVDHGNNTQLNNDNTMIHKQVLQFEYYEGCLRQDAIDVLQRYVYIYMYIYGDTDAM